MIKATKEGIRAAVILVCAALLAVSLGYYFGVVKRQQDYEMYMEQGKTALLNDDPELASRNFQQAMNIYLENSAPYIALYKAYVREGNEQAAQSLIISAQSNLSASELETFNTEAASYTLHHPIFLYRIYDETLTKELETRGQADWDPETKKISDGLLCADLADLDASGMKELVMAVQKKDGAEYVIYGYRDGTVNRLASLPLYVRQDAPVFWITRDAEGKLNLVTGNTTDQVIELKFYQLEEGKLTPVMSLERRRLEKETEDQEQEADGSLEEDSSQEDSEESDSSNAQQESESQSSVDPEEDTAEKPEEDPRDREFEYFVDGTQVLAAQYDEAWQKVAGDIDERIDFDSAKGAESAAALLQHTLKILSDVINR